MMEAGDLYLAALFGLLGYLLQKSGCETVPLLLGFVLGPLFEEHLRRALLLSEGSATVLVTEPLSALLLLVSAVLLATILLPAVRRQRETAFVE